MKITTTAVLHGKGYNHFGIHPISASLYGNSEEDIVTVELVPTENQVKPTHKEEVAVKRADDGIYWAWVEEEGSCSLIYPTYFQLNMCFPYGIPTAEARGNDKAMRMKLLDTCELLPRE